MRTFESLPARLDMLQTPSPALLYIFDIYLVLGDRVSSCVLHLRLQLEPAQTKQVSKETYYRGKRDLLYADF
jgi:hypothetical protein